jgi:hypothetical protein
MFSTSMVIGDDASRNATCLVMAVAGDGVRPPFCCFFPAMKQQKSVREAGFSRRAFTQLLVACSSDAYCHL